MRRMLCWAMLLPVLMVGVLGGCDAAAKATIMSGLETGATSIATALITAGFQSMANNGSDTTATTGS